MDATTTNLGSHGNDENGGNGGDERWPSEEGAGESGGKDKGKGKMTEAQEEAEECEREERACKALKQHWEEVMSWVAAEKEKIWDAEVVATGLAQALSEMEVLDTADPHFAWGITPKPVDFHRSPTTSGPVRDEE
jgi:hypothetical protein